MYSSFGSRAVGSGKRGHGGRNYRPPPDRSSFEEKPPPLKFCDCLIEFDIEEYQSVGVREHRIFRGRRALTAFEKDIRKLHRVHLVVPGRQQSGPVAIVGRTLREAIAGAETLMHQLQIDNDKIIQGRIHANVKDITLQPVQGQWRKAPPRSPCYLLFVSEQWSILACFAGNTEEKQNLAKALDDVLFRLGQSALENIDIFGMTEDTETIFCVGSTTKIRVLFSEAERNLRVASTIGTAENMQN